MIYEIPLDNARRDAAPTRAGAARVAAPAGRVADDVRPAGAGTGAGAGGVTTANGTMSPIRSENGFGSSSQVPGVAAAVAAKLAARAAASKPGSGKQLAAAPSAGHDLAGREPRAAEGRDGRATPSKSRAYLLLALALAVAAGIGVAGRYVARRR